MVVAMRFNAAESPQHLGGADLSYRKLAEFAVDEFDEPAVFCEGRFGKAFLFSLCEPVIGERRKIVVRGKARRFLDGRGVPALRQMPAGF